MTSQRQLAIWPLLYLSTSINTILQFFHGKNDKSKTGASFGWLGWSASEGVARPLLQCCQLNFSDNCCLSHFLNVCWHIAIMWHLGDTLHLIVENLFCFLELRNKEYFLCCNEYFTLFWIQSWKYCPNIILLHVQLYMLHHKVWLKALDNGCNSLRALLRSRCHITLNISWAWTLTLYYMCAIQACLWFGKT